MDKVNPESHELNMRILDLAFDCLFINAYEKEQSVAKLEEKYKEDPQAAVTDIFKEEGLVSDENIEFLLSFDEHIKLRSKDRKFGEIAVANELARSDDIFKGLELQKKRFETSGVSVKLGDILVENKTLSPSARASILLTQNRVRNENLLDTLNEIHATEAQKRAAEKRFGVLAIKMELISIDQFNHALSTQENEKKEGKSRFIGQILQEEAQLSEENILDILNEQKQIEKRLLNLEKALYTTHSEAKIVKKLNKLFEYRISGDGVEAIVKKIRQPEKEMPVFEFLIWLKRMGINFGIVKDSVLEDFIRTAELKTEVVAARGHAAVPPRDETAEFFFENELNRKPDADAPAGSELTPEEDAPGEDTAGPGPENEPPGPVTEAPLDESGAQDNAEDLKPEETPEEEQMETDASLEEGEEQAEQAPETDNSQKESDAPGETSDNDPKEELNPDPDESGEESKNPGEKTRSEEVQEAEEEPEPPDMIEKGNLIARILPGEAGRPGKDVLGHIIHPEKPKLCVLHAGKNVVKKGPLYIASVTGVPVLKNHNTLAVEPGREKRGLKTIMGSLSRDTDDAYADLDVVINGDIQPSAVLNCRGLILGGNLTGIVHSSGSIIVKGSIGTDQKAKGEEEIPAASVDSGGNIQVAKEITNSTINAAGKLLAQNAAVNGSAITAAMGIVVRDVSRTEKQTSLLQFGLKPGDAILKIEARIDEKQAELSLLKKEKEIRELTEKYEQDLEKENIRQMEQKILKALLEIMAAPELGLYDGLDQKLDHLYSLPGHSSIRSYYLKIPDTKQAQGFVQSILKSTKKMKEDEVIDLIGKKIDPGPERQAKEEEDPENQETAVSSRELIETDFRARLNAFQQEAENSSEQIHALKEEIHNLESERKILCDEQIPLINKSGAAVQIKNKCEKGTVIKGRVAGFIMETTVYRVQFREVYDPASGDVSITVHSL